MSAKNFTDDKVHIEEEEDDEEDDEDYAPIKNEQEQSSSSEEVEEEQVEETKPADSDVAPYDESKTNELWKNFTSSTKSTTTKTESPETTATESPKPTTKVFDYAGEKSRCTCSTTQSIIKTSSGCFIE